MTDLTHAQTLLILAIALSPAILQAIMRGAIHGLWVAVAMLGAIFTVVTW